MCLILDHRANATPVPHDRLVTIGERNKDGFGYAIMRPDGLVSYARGVGLSPEDVAGWYAERLAGQACVMHWRLATHGPKDEAHAHPFPLGETDDGIARAAVFHNGVFSGMGSAAESDTAAIVRTVLQPLTRDGTDLAPLDDPQVKALLEKLLGGVLVIVGGGQIRRYGGAGVEHGGHWYSNRYSWEDRAPAQVYTGARRWWDDGEPSSYYWRDDMLVQHAQTRAPRVQPAPKAQAPIRYLAKGESREIRRVARVLYHGPSVVRTAEQTQDDRVLAEVIGSTGRLRVTDREAVTEILARRRGAGIPPPAPAPSVPSVESIVQACNAAIDDAPRLKPVDDSCALHAPEDLDDDEKAILAVFGAWEG